MINRLLKSLSLRQFGVVTLLLLSTASHAQQAVDLQKLFGKTDEFLEVDQAFSLSVDTYSDELIANWKIEPTYYLYQHQLQVRLKNAKLGTVILPEGKHKTDEYFGEVQTYYKSLQLGIPFELNTSPVFVEIRFQGCAEAGLCYPPTNRYFKINNKELTSSSIDEATFDAVNSPVSSWSAPALDKNSDSEKASNENKDVKDKSSNTKGKSEKTQETNKAPSEKKKFVSEKDKIIDTLNESVIVGFFSLILLGIGLAFTPCVFPMMPIISSIIAGQGKDITTSKAFFLSLTYTQAMAIPYVIIGGVVAGVGASATATLQSPPFIIGAAIVFIILSLGMFGFFEIQLPAAMQNKLNNVSQKQQSGTYIGAAIMGAISGAVVSPCVTIPLIAVLTWISTVGDALTGAFYLYGLSIGMGIPLIILGVGGGKLLPSAGSWMNAVKAVFGVMMVAVALYITKHLIPAHVNLLLWGGLVIVCSIYMGALAPLEHAASGWEKFWKGVGFVLLVYGASLIVGAAMGNTSLFTPLANNSLAHTSTIMNNDSGLVTSNNQNINNKASTKGNIHDGFILIKNNDDLDRYLEKANAEGKTVMLDFFAEYCAACYEFAKLTFPKPQVQAALSNTILLQADVTAGDAEDRALMERFGIFGLPSILFFDKSGNEISGLRAEGFEDADTFAARIDAAIGE
ncbi:MAG: protein-disulfide reductase DsbD [Gammaproteobacteria bacterium]|nr:protein-disulfide reductase DsbD [Gammaproteobacteria bacterium]